MVIKWGAAARAVGVALMSAAKEIEGSSAGQAVEADAKKTLTDGVNAAIGYVQQNAAPAATSSLSGVLTKFGMPSAFADLLAEAGVAQGEGFLTKLAGVL